MRKFMLFKHKKLLMKNWPAKEVEYSNISQDHLVNIVHSKTNLIL